MIPADALKRAELNAHRLCDRAIVRAQESYVIWQTFNSSDNPLRRPMMENPAAHAINAMSAAVLNEVILLLVASTDRRGRFSLEQTNKVSFPIALELLSIPGVMDEVFRRSNNTEINCASFERYRAAIERLHSEQPNRLRLLRNYRDEFLAHHLDFPAGRPPPIVNDITTMLAELSAIAADLELTLYARRVVWEERVIAMRTSAQTAWTLIAQSAES